VYQALALTVACAAGGTLAHIKYHVGSTWWSLCLIGLVFALYATPNTPNNQQKVFCIVCFTKKILRLFKAKWNFGCLWFSSGFGCWTIGGVGKTFFFFVRLKIIILFQVLHIDPSIVLSAFIGSG
jgi:hypothetical protein